MKRGLGIFWGLVGAVAVSAMSVSASMQIPAHLTTHSAKS